MYIFLLCYTVLSKMNVKKRKWNFKIYSTEVGVELPAIGVMSNGWGASKQIEQHRKI